MCIRDRFAGGHQLRQRAHEQRESRRPIVRPRIFAPYGGKRRTVAQMYCSLAGWLDVSASGAHAGDEGPD
eukprot:2721000-Pyramimonas_sp.AAC.1